MHRVDGQERKAWPSQPLAYKPSSLKELALSSLLPVAGKREPAVHAPATLALPVPKNTSFWLSDSSVEAATDAWLKSSFCSLPDVWTSDNSFIISDPQFLCF